jgi:hypothetical protein
MSSALYDGDGDGDRGPAVRAPGRRREVADADRDRAIRTIRGLSGLLDTRPDLHGVHAPADLTYDAIRWTA